MLFNLGRAVGGLGPLLVGLAASAHGFEFAISALAVLYVIDLENDVALDPGAARRRAAIAGNTKLSLQRPQIGDDVGGVGIA